MRSLQFRLSTGLFVSLVLAFIVLWVLVSQASRVLAEEYIVTRLEHDGETLLASLIIENTGNINTDDSRINPIYLRPFSGHYYKIISQHVSLRSRSLWDQDIDIQALPVGSQLRRYMEGPQQQPLIVLIKAFSKAGQSITIAMAEDLSPIKDRLVRLQFYFIITAIIFMLALVAIQVWILHAGLRPLDKARNELKALSQGKLAQLDKEVPAEISPLVDEINHLLNVLDQRLIRSRNALGDLAHTLKKPLTVLKQMVEDESIKNNPELYKLISAQLETIQRHVTRILQRARLAGEGPVASQFNAREDIPPLLATLKSIYHDKSLAFISDFPSNLTIMADREDMLELIGNLLDNACKWATHTVRITLTQNQKTEISIEDDGPGVATDQLISLTQRGLRLDEKTDGHGLGLSIVNEIISSLGGELKLQPSETLGGLHAKVILPGNRD
ncbi:MAG: ATP-binding protein [Gammaproteobacteria bacterium]|jgi:signal transduction histidine kinase